ncbi:hypothetical protein BC829DRAFT_394926 [Chytridium lagenaria]|nr:hypothetical protein BC829DRAFT_394926 [Chytridium lagenaria]
MGIAKKFRAIILIGGIIAVLAAVVVVVGVFNGKEGQRKKGLEFDSLEVNTDFPTSSQQFNNNDIEAVLTEKGFIGEFYKNCASYNYVIVEAKITNLDLVNGIYKIKLDFSPCGDFIDRSKVSVGKSLVLGMPLRISFDNKIYNFSAGTPMASQDFQTTFDAGDINNYPFDKYTAEDLYTEGTYNDPNSSNRTTPVPIALYFNGALLTHHLKDESTTNPPKGDIIRLDFNVSRSLTTIFFSTLVMVIMWVLSLLAFTLAVTLWMRGRKVEPPTIAFSIALIFALPGIRNTQPGTPPIGCTADAVSFFWAMSLSAATAACLMINYILKYNFDYDAVPAPMKQESNVKTTTGKDLEGGVVDVPLSVVETSSKTVA